MNEKKVAWITSVIFLIIIYGLSICTILIDKKNFSENENRYLRKLPLFNIDRLINNDLTNKYDEYFNDHFIFRDHWTKLKVTIDYLACKKESNGVYLSKDYLAEDIKDNGKNYSIENTSEIIRFANKFNNTSNIYFTLIPSTCEIQNFKLPKYAVTFNQLDFINRVYKKTQSSIKNVNIYNNLLLNKKDYIYYRTDHHWTLDGAYIAYKKMAQVMGINPIAYDNLDIRTITKDFKGSLLSKCGFDYVKYDEIKALNNNNIDKFIVYNGKSKTTYKSIYFKDFLDKKDKYSYFLGVNQPKVVIKMNNAKHYNRKLLIFKDSYSHCLAPFLSYSYDEITLLDMRYINMDITKLINISDYDDILFMYSIDVFLNTKNTSKLSYSNYDN
ncbi:DHHW family protein [Clostridiaceae bacterium M8S5]|nr:DHHW family protein [Clostridiaceae bacterium M8S5]